MVDFYEIWGSKGAYYCLILGNLGSCEILYHFIRIIALKEIFNLNILILLQRYGVPKRCTRFLRAF